jgi:hypothetical protein
MKFKGKFESFPDHLEQKVTINFAWLPTQMDCGTWLWFEKYETTWVYLKYVIPVSMWEVKHKTIIR